jgi:ABC-type antimicrobial peptide transport system permease subunit
MIAVALKGVAGRKVRALLTALAIVIGVTMVSGTLVLTDTIQKGFDSVFGASYEQTDAVIAGTVVAILAGLAAAIMPARRASRLNVLDALHYE